MLKNEQKIINWYLVTQGLIIKEVVAFDAFLLLYPVGVIYRDKPYQEQILGLKSIESSVFFFSRTKFKKLLKRFPEISPQKLRGWWLTSLEMLGVDVYPDWEDSQGEFYSALKSFAHR